jgi:nanoRNase/pAp phosphatase (c-di-AMP/oligoRNAs hydrolase)
MIEPIDIQKFRDLIEKANDILIVTHEKPTPDSIGSALTLYLGLASLGKKVTVACPDPMTVELSSFVGVNKVVSEVHKKNFIISLDYIEGSIEKVSYNIEGDKFNLVIEPRPGFDTFSSEKVHYLNSGAGADLIITVDTIHLGGLKKLYDDDKDLFASHPVINIDRHSNNANYGQLNLLNPSSATTVEIVSKLMSGIDIQLSEDIATNILNTLCISTNNFQSPFVTSDTFELMAACYKVGGKRFGKKANEDIPIAEEALEPINQMINEPPDIAEHPTPTKATSTIPVITKKPFFKSKDAPADWLKPKIFKSTSTL